MVLKRQKRVHIKRYGSPNDRRLPITFGSVLKSFNVNIITERKLISKLQVVLGSVWT